MRAGRLRHRVSLQQPATTADSFGQPSLSFSEQATARASIEPLTGREFLDSQQTRSNVSHRVRIRAVDIPTGFDTDWRVVFGSRTFEIEAIMDVMERNREYEIEVVERKT